MVVLILGKIAAAHHACVSNDETTPDAREMKAGT
jgi:hypothetical protein